MKIGIITVLAIGLGWILLRNLHRTDSSDATSRDVVATKTLQQPKQSLPSAPPPEPPASEISEEPAVQLAPERVLAAQSQQARIDEAREVGRQGDATALLNFLAALPIGEEAWLFGKVAIDAFLASNHDYLGLLQAIAGSKDTIGNNMFAKATLRTLDRWFDKDTLKARSYVNGLPKDSILYSTAKRNSKYQDDLISSNPAGLLVYFRDLLPNSNEAFPTELAMRIGRSESPDKALNSLLEPNSADEAALLAMSTRNWLLNDFGSAEQWLQSIPPSTRDTILTESWLAASKGNSELGDRLSQLASDPMLKQRIHNHFHPVTPPAK